MTVNGWGKGIVLGLGIVYVVALLVVLPMTLTAIREQTAYAGQLIDVLDKLLSWEVVATGVIGGAGFGLRNELARRLLK